MCTYSLSRWVGPRHFDAYAFARGKSGESQPIRNSNETGGILGCREYLIVTAPLARCAIPPRSSQHNSIVATSCRMVTCGGVCIHEWPSSLAVALPMVFDVICGTIVHSYCCPKAKLLGCVT